MDEDKWVRRLIPITIGAMVLLSGLLVATTVGYLVKGC